MHLKSERLGTVAALAAGLLLAAPACVTPGGIFDGDVYGDGGVYGRRSAVVHGEVRSVDTRRNRVQVREEWGRSRTLRYDGRTQVVYRRRRYPVSALERGDAVSVRVVYDRNRTPWADRIDVRRSVRDRYGIVTRVQRLDGRVRRLDTRRRYFTLDLNRSRDVVVYVRGGVRRDDLRRFERLRGGQRVRVDVRPLDRGAAELVRFR